MTNITVLVCGGREITPEQKTQIFQTLTNLHNKYPIGCIIHGDATGVDRAAEEWAKVSEIPYMGFPAKWSEYGNSAGPRRNLQMILRLPNIVVAFPGGKGTENMKSMAKEYKIQLWEPEYK